MGATLPAAAAAAGAPALGAASTLGTATVLMEALIVVVVVATGVCIVVVAVERGTPTSETVSSAADCTGDDGDVRIGTVMCTADEDMLHFEFVTNQLMTVSMKTGMKSPRLWKLVNRSFVFVTRLFWCSFFSFLQWKTKSPLPSSLSWWLLFFSRIICTNASA